MRSRPGRTDGLRRYVDNLSMVYTVGPQADPKGVVRQITEALRRLGMGTFAANHEFMNSQYEINLRHAPGADRRRPRVPAEVARSRTSPRMHGLIATFMGKPFNDQGGSGFHLHFSLDRDDDNAFADHDDPDGVSRRAAPLHRRRARPRPRADRVPEPDDQRLPAARARLARADSRSTGAGTTARRSSASRPSAARASRVEIRVGDGSANPYLGDRRDAVRRPARRCARSCRSARPGRAATPTRSTSRGEPLPLSLEAALDALEADALPARRDGPGRSSTPFLAMKRFELERHRAWVSDWELDEYLHHL